MELVVVEENGVKKFDTSVAGINQFIYMREQHALRWVLNHKDVSGGYIQDHKQKYMQEGFQTALKRAKLERNNAERIQAVMEKLSNCWLDHNKPERYFFLTDNGRPALPEELAPSGFFTYTNGYQIIPIDRFKKVQCSGCMKMHPLIICHYDVDREKQLVICGNSLHILSDKAVKFQD